MTHAQAQEALSGYLPQVNGTGQLDDNLKRQTTILPAGIFSSEPTPVKFGTQYNTSLSLQGEQTLVDVGKLNGIQAIKPDIKRADIQLQQAEEKLIYDVARAYAKPSPTGSKRACWPTTFSNTTTFSRSFNYVRKKALHNPWTSTGPK
ncbi:MAG: hypothetical protein IPO56_16225 [Flavobacteriales bacterium]|nr:hypothetical protein [Flavobacteriales bacterium]